MGKDKLMDIIEETQNYLSFPVLHNYSASAASNIGVELDDFETPAHEMKPMPGRTQNAGMFVAECEWGIALSDIRSSCQNRKYFWRKQPFHRFSGGPAAQPIVIEVLDEQIGFPGETTTSTVPWPELWQSDEKQTDPLRGIIIPTYERRILFTKTIRFKTHELPRRKFLVRI